MDISSKKDIQVLISSHILSDIEAVCSYVLILNKGKVANQGDLQALKQLDYSLYELKVKGETERFVNTLRAMEWRVEETEDGMLKVYMPPGESPQEIFRVADAGGHQVRHFVKSQTSLEDLFAEVVGVD